MDARTYRRRADLAAKLDELGKGRRERQRQHRAFIDAMREIVPQALDLGLTKTEICELAHISRPTLDQMLKEPQR